MEAPFSLTTNAAKLTQAFQQMDGTTPTTITGLHFDAGTLTTLVETDSIAHRNICRCSFDELRLKRSIFRGMSLTFDQCAFADNRLLIESSEFHSNDPNVLALGFVSCAISWLTFKDCKIGGFCLAGHMRAINISFEGCTFTHTILFNFIGSCACKITFKQCTAQENILLHILHGRPSNVQIRCDKSSRDMLAAIMPKREFERVLPLRRK